MFNIVSALMKLSKRCECGAILQFEGMFCLGVAGADQLPYKMDLLLRCNNGLLSLICRLSRGGDLIRNTLELPMDHKPVEMSCQSGCRGYHGTET
ncbi:hypothetical protein EV1_045011 [Malus domestica]